MSAFQLVSEYPPAGDQPEAIARLVAGFRSGMNAQVLEGVTGSGKTFTMANVIRDIGLPTLVVSHNKTLAAQLFGEFKAFFPENAVEYFVSYYDYYQPEAYIPQTDTYIAKDAAINDEIERFRLSATNSLLCRKDVIVVASVSCIYGLGSSDDYTGMTLSLEKGQEVDRDAILARLVEIQYQRNDVEPQPGVFRVRGDTVDVFPSYNKIGIRLSLFGDELEEISEFDPTSGRATRRLDRTIVSPAKHFVMPHERMMDAIADIEAELDERVAWFEAKGKLLEAQRLQQRTRYDMEMFREIGYCTGIENYSRHLAGRPAGSPGECLIDFFPKPFLTIIDESHATLPQIRGMYNGDQARKTVLVDHGFRLPSAKDNRPLNFEEFNSKIEQTLYVSATPAPYERGIAGQVVSQVIRPTGLLDPPVEVRPLKRQIDDLMEEVRSCAERGDRVLATTLTKRTAEDLSQYLKDAGLRVEYLHSDIDALERVAVLTRLRKGEFDALIGINLLREGLDLPEVALVAVLDADKEGFLRSATSLMQTAGRTARHEAGRVILYADQVTDSMRTMIETTERRRQRQIAHNEAHGITPRSVKRALSEDDAVRSVAGEIERRIIAEDGADYDVARAIADIQREMLEAAEALEFERAAVLRDELRELQASLNPETRPKPSPQPRQKRRKKQP
ncbi:MAG: excinuclease ABC subunit UvrB [Kiritimatiellia bacterium]